MAEDGLTRVDIRGVDAAYRRPGADLNKYRKVMLDSVQVAFDPDRDPKRTGSNLKLSAEDRERIRRELAGNTGMLQGSGSVMNSDDARRLFTRWAQLLRQRFDAVRNAPAPAVNPS